DDASRAPRPGADATDQPATPPAPQANPHHGGGFARPPMNVSRAAASLPPGTIDVEVVDAAGEPIPRLPVDLHITYENIAEGTQDKTVRRTTDERGKIRFDSLSRELRYSYALATDY